MGIGREMRVPMAMQGGLVAERMILMNIWVWMSRSDWWLLGSRGWLAETGLLSRVCTLLLILATRPVSLGWAGGS